jgi:hypothetical protein
MESVRAKSSTKLTLDAFPLAFRVDLEDQQSVFHKAVDLAKRMRGPIEPVRREVERAETDETVRDVLLPIYSKGSFEPRCEPRSRLIESSLPELSKTEIAHAVGRQLWRGV